MLYRLLAHVVLNLRRLQKLADLATVVSWSPALERPSLEDWVHPDGGLLIIGDAAHPYPVRSPFAKL